MKPKPETSYLECYKPMCSTISDDPMKTSSLITLGVLSICCHLQAQNASSQQMAQFVDAWTKAFNGEDIDSFMNLVAEDVVLFMPAGPVKGKEAMRGLYSPYFNTYDLQVTLDVKETETLGEKVYLAAWVGGTRTLKESGTVEPISVHNMWILTPEKGKLKFWRIMFVGGTTAD